MFDLTSPEMDHHQGVNDTAQDICHFAKPRQAATTVGFAGDTRWLRYIVEKRRKVFALCLVNKVTVSAWDVWDSFDGNGI